MLSNGRHAIFTKRGKLQKKNWVKQKRNLQQFQVDNKVYSSLWIKMKANR